MVAKRGSSELISLRKAAARPYHVIAQSAHELLLVVGCLNHEVPVRLIEHADQLEQILDASCDDMSWSNMKRLRRLIGIEA